MIANRFEFLVINFLAEITNKLMECEMKTDLRKFRGKKAVIGKISQILDGNFVDHYCVKIGGYVFTNNSGVYKFDTEEEAKKARIEIKEKLIAEIVKLDSQKHL